METERSVLKGNVVAEEFVWKIENFSLYKDKYRSPKLTFQSESWWLGVYPNPGDGYIYLDINRNTPGAPIAVEFTLALKTSDGHKICERGGTEFFDEWMYAVTYRMIRKSEFKRRQPELLSSGCLTLILTMKREDFLEPAGRRHFFRSRYIPVDSSAPVSRETLPVVTTSDSVKNENASGEFEWKIENFTLTEYPHESPEFTLESETWEFVGISKLSDGYIDLDVIRMSSGSPILVKFTFALQTSDGQNIFERVETEIFHEWKYTCDYRWMKRSEFEDRQSEFLTFGCLKAVITVKIVDSLEPATASAMDVCSCCKENLNGDKIAVHKKCFDRSVKCPRCAEAVTLQNWSDQKCQMATAKAASAMDVCSCCRESLRGDKTAVHKENWHEHECQMATKNAASASAVSSSHRDFLPGDKIAVDKKHLDKPVKCPVCAEVLSLQNWFNHECSMETGKGECEENCDVVLRAEGQETSSQENIVTDQPPATASTSGDENKEKKKSKFEGIDIYYEILAA